jgi:hypothetical protein
MPTPHTSVSPLPRRALAAIIAAIATVALPALAQPTESLQTAPAPAGKDPLPAAISATAIVPPDQEDQALPTLLQSLTPDEQAYFQHVVTLSSPFFEGRAPGHRGNALAADYVEHFLRALKFNPVFPTPDAGQPGPLSFRQRFPAGTDLKLTAQRLAQLSPNDAAPTELTPGTDFNVLGISATGEVTAPITFVGYAIQNGPEGYSTFTDTDRLDGQIAVLLRFEPKNEKGASRWANEGGWSPAAGLAAKLQAVASRGAAAIILVNPPNADDPRVDQLDDYRSFRRGTPSQSVPVLMLSIPAADRILQSAGTSLAALTTAADQRGGITPLPNTRLALSAGIERIAVDADNVAAVLPGRGSLADEFLIIGAHLDHLGQGHFGSRDAQGSGKLHPGADDNASGTAGLLLAAQRLRAAMDALPPDQPARSILFIGFNAEESGLIGARYFVSHSPIPAAKTYAMLNMDMIGRVRNGHLDVSGTGTAEGFADLLQPHFARSGLNVRSLPGGQGPSDHAAFYASEVPVLHFFSGITPEYHMPTDTYPTINPRGGTRTAHLVSNIALALATRAEPLTFTRSSGQSIDLTPPSANPHGQPGQLPQAAGPGMGGVRVRFGIAPGSYSDDKPGIEVGDVYPRTTAADIGLKTGDRMTAWNGEPLRDVEGWMKFLSAAKPGDQVEITWIRDGQEMKAKGTLKARDRGDR